MAIKDELKVEEDKGDEFNSRLEIETICEILYSVFKIDSRRFEEPTVKYFRWTRKLKWPFSSSVI